MIWIGISAFLIGSVWNYGIDGLDVLSKQNLMRSALLGVSAGGINYMMDEIEVPEMYGVSEALLAGGAYAILSSVGLPYTENNMGKEFIKGALVDFAAIQVNSGVKHVYNKLTGRTRDYVCKAEVKEALQQCPADLKNPDEFYVLN